MAGDLTTHGVTTHGQITHVRPMARTWTGLKGIPAARVV
jgi:hypothetical protein